MAWAEEAHWSIGGLSFKRLRLQRKIEGNVEKLRSQLEKAWPQSPTPSRSPPTAPIVTKRRRFMDLIEEEKEVESPMSGIRRLRLVKKLGDDFDRVALENIEGSDTTPLKTRRRLVKGGELVKKTVVEEAQKTNPKGQKKSASEAEKTPRVRTSPRLVKRVSN